ncbi:hypothetical protein P280DRAFT_267809 [Massarina eburnea CBS 473.64]|uniref:Histone acetyltransferase n=1 Tax=Massarina eburnea CBS 473.64 TaxID=1395130 RepID=A0A6A6S699_9PLEO|nr:hypothetical protein P280DRAFT_267809 [Massarina eburnea CBS 473.64]
MAEPGRLMGQSAGNVDPEDIDADGEYEEDDMGYELATGEHTQEEDGRDMDAEGSDVDAEGEDVDDDDDDDDSEPVGAVKIAAPESVFSDDEHDGNARGDESSNAKTSDSENDSGSESDAENQWEGQSEDEEEPEMGKVDPNVCIYCHGDEENDPSEEFEMVLSCSSCGDMAHRQCARDASTLSPNDDAQDWRCTNCKDNGLHGDDHSETNSRRRHSSVPRLTRDLLPSHRGKDPGGHSIFNELILPDDSVDGSRSLRKRKASHEDDVQPVRQTRKKRRSSELSGSVVAASAAASSPHPQGRSAVTDGEDSDDNAHNSESEEEGSRLRSARARRTKPQRKDKRPLVWIEESQGLSLVIVFHLNNEKVQKIVTSKPKKKGLTLEQERQERRRERDRERRERNRRAAQAARDSVEESHYPTVQPHYTAPFHGFADKEMDENKSKPFGGILSEADADTSKTYPTQADRKRFEDARQKAEEDWKQKQAALYAADEPAKRPKETGPPSKIKCINFGGWEIDTWHAAPYPEEYSKNKVLYICEFCLKYMPSDYVAWRHKLKCPAKHPPGDEIYRDGKYSFFEVDGRKNPVYCQNLCLLAKLFLGSKTLYYDVEPFLFYVMTENDNYGCHFVGYFSKEKRPSSLNNVSCILVLPIHMRKGYGQYLIEFSYLLTKVEQKTGSPEKPLSDMGLVSYRKYWRLIICEELLNQKAPVSIAAISERTGMTSDDIVSALEGLRALVRDPPTGKYALRLDYGYFKQYLEKANSTDNPKINPECLVWTPYVMGRLGQYEDGPTLHTVQQREEGEDEGKAEPEEGVQMDMATKANGASQNGSATGEENDGAATPALPAEGSAYGGSPVPGTPLANGSMVAVAGSQITTAAPSIPATRYEVYPPIPGQPPPKRRPGRPFGSRRRVNSTPQRHRANNMTIATAPPARMRPFSPNSGGQHSPSLSANGGTLTPVPSSLRRTRSHLNKSITNGDVEEMEGGEVKAIRTRGMRSETGSPKGAVNGRMRRVVLDEDDDEEEMEEEEEEMEEMEEMEEGDDGGEDVDGEGEEDVDAEGEDDDDVIMGGV